MLRSLLVLHLLLSGVIVMFGQQNRYVLDSLIRKDLGMPGDTHRVLLEIEISRTYRSSRNLDSSGLFASKALTLAEEIHFNKGKGLALACLGHVENDKYNFPGAIAIHRKALAIRKEMKDDYLTGGSLQNIGNVYGRLNNNDSALVYFKLSLPYFVKSNKISTVADCYYNIGDSFLRIYQPDSALQYLHLSKALSRDSEYPSGEAKALMNIGAAHMAKGELEAALANLNESESMARNAHLTYLYPFIFSQLGLLHKDLGNYEKGLDYMLETADIYSRQSNKRGLFDAYFIISEIYLAQKDTSNTLKYILLTIKLTEELNIPALAGTAYYNFGHYYMLKEDYKNASEQMLTALDLFQQNNDRLNVANCYNKLGIFSYEQKLFEEAVTNFEKSIDIYEVLNHSFSLAKIYPNLANAYFHIWENDTTGQKGQYFEKALRLNLKSKEFLETAGARKDLIYTYNSLANNYEVLDDFKSAYTYKMKAYELKDSLYNEEVNDKLKTMQSKFDIAVAIAEEKSKKDQELAQQRYDADRKLNEEKAKAELRLVTEKIRREKAIAVARAQHELDLARKQIEKEQALHDQRLNAEKNLAVLDAMHALQMANEKSIQVQHENQRKTRNTYIVGSVLGGILLTIFYFLWRHQKSAKQKAIDQANVVRQMAELELQSLRSQLNPHFMFNSLNAIQELILLEENEKSHSYLSHFATLLRMLLENANTSLIPLSKELEFLELYLSLEKLRLPDLTYAIEVDSTIREDQVKIPNMMLQPYIENAIWHGLSYKKDGKRNIHVNIHREKNKMIYEIWDNGIGRKKAEELKNAFRKAHRSKGMELLTKRFKLLSEEFKFEIKTEIIDLFEANEAAGTKVRIETPEIFKVDSPIIVS